MVNQNITTRSSQNYQKASDLRLGMYAGPQSLGALNLPLHNQLQADIDFLVKSHIQAPTDHYNQVPSLSYVFSQYRRKDLLPLLFYHDFNIHANWFWSEI